MIYVRHNLSAAFCHSLLDHFFHFIMFSAVSESRIGSFRKKLLPLRIFSSDFSGTFQPLTHTENLDVTNLQCHNLKLRLCWKWKKEEFLVLFCCRWVLQCAALSTWWQCDSRWETPLKSPLFSCQFLLFRLKKNTDLLKREEEGKNTVPGLK